MLLNWAFTAHWFVSFGGADRRLTEQGRNRGRTPSSSTGSIRLLADFSAAGYVHIGSCN
jgi:hypothetical protein